MREFVCKKCGETEAVHPGLPDDYMPNICRDCGEKSDAERQRFMARLFADLSILSRGIEALGRS